MVYTVNGCEDTRTRLDHERTKFQLRIAAFTLAPAEGGSGQRLRLSMLARTYSYRPSEEVVP